MRPVNRGLEPTRPDGSKKLYKTYGDLRLDLIGRLGEYCSYCEVPLGVSLAVEHMLSKTATVNHIDWNNSLLACTNCNSHKRDATQSEADLNNYLWPPIDYRPSTPGNTFDMLCYTRAKRTLQSLVNDGLLTLPQQRAARPYVQISYDQVWVTVSPLYTGQPVEERIKSSIRLTGLNDYVPETENAKVSDRRIANRTAAWDRAMLAAAYLAEYYQPYNECYQKASSDIERAKVVQNAGLDRTICLLLAQTRALAVATGFWSVWMTVFLDSSRTFITPEVRTRLICHLFVRPFAGTRLPLAGINACP